MSEKEMGSNVSLVSFVIEKKFLAIQGAREKALQLLREVPRLSHHNLKGLPKVFLRNINFHPYTKQPSTVNTVLYCPVTNVLRWLEFKINQIKREVEVKMEETMGGSSFNIIQF